MKVIFANWLSANFLNFDTELQLKITEFAVHVEQHGLKGLQGRNKSSAIANPHTKRQKAQFAFAQKHCLWHYHIGIPEYIGEFGDMTSQMILHYIRYNEFIVLVDITEHPPFSLPTTERLAYHKIAR